MEKELTKVRIANPANAVWLSANAFTKAECEGLVNQMNKDIKDGVIEDDPTFAAVSFYISDPEVKEREEWKSQDAMLHERLTEVLQQLYDNITSTYKVNLPKVWSEDRGYVMVKHTKGFEEELFCPVKHKHNLIVEIFLTDFAEMTFPLQQQTIKPKRGDVLIYPFFWTHPIQIKETKKVCYSLKTVIDG